MGSDGKWWHTSNRTIDEYNLFIKILKNETSVFITAENTDALNYETSLSKAKGSDKDNIDEMYRTLKVHCYCFYSKGEVLDAKNATMEALEIIKEKETVTQVRMKFMDYQDHIETVDITDVQFQQFMGMQKQKGKNRISSTRNYKMTDFYKPYEEAKKIDSYKEM